MTPEALEQRQTALLKANKVRTGVARFKRDTKAMTKREAAEYLATALESPTDALLRADVRLLLMSVPQIGTEKASRMLFMVRAERRARVRDLTEGQRAGVALLLRTWGARWP